MRSTRSHLLRRVFPFLRWLPLPPGALRADLIAGITVSLVLIPQSMAYAQLAGLPAYYGLYAAFLPVLVGALWGSSNQLSTGPVAMVSLLTASALVQFASPGAETYVALAIVLAFMVGFIQFALGVLHLGAIVSFISHPVIVGFTNAAAIIIGLSQLNKLLGVSVGRSSNFLADIWGVLEQIRETHLPTLAIGVAAFALMYGLRRYRPKWPAVLIAVFLTTVLSWAIGFERNLQATIADLADDDARVLAVAFVEDAKTIVGIDRLIEEKAAQRTATPGTSARDEQHRLTLDYQVQTLRLERRALESENRLRLRALRRFHFVRRASPRVCMPPAAFKQKLRRRLSGGAFSTSTATGCDSQAAEKSSAKFLEGSPSFGSRRSRWKPSASCCRPRSSSRWSHSWRRCRLPRRWPLGRANASTRIRN